RGIAVIPRSIRLPLLVACCLLVPLASGLGSITLASAAPEQAGPPSEVSAEVHHDVSRPLRELPSAPRTDPPREIPLRRLVAGASTGQPDGALQSSVSGTNVATSSALNFAGVGKGDYGFSPNAAPPDTNG